MMAIAAPEKPEVPWWLVQLAERKLGRGATVKKTDAGWTAERTSGRERARITGGARDTLVWFLEQMPDRKDR